MSKRKILNVLYQSDDNYAVVSAISIASLCENNKHLDEINIFYLGHKLRNINIDKFNKLVANYKNTNIIFVDTEKYHTAFQELGVKSWRGLYVTWYKMLAFADLGIKTDRILYINPHTIICGALDYLLDMDFEDNVMALSYDPLINSHKITIELKPTDGYFNCGIMLINRKKWIKDNIDAQMKKALAKKSDYLIVDQDFCNVFFKGKIKKIGVEYNFSTTYYGYDVKKFLKVNDLRPDYFYSYEEIMADYYSPKIIHSQFGLKGRPWEAENNSPNKYLWQKYLEITPWRNSKMPAAKRTLNWLLYDLLPMSLLLRLYAYAVNKKFGK